MKRVEAYEANDKSLHPNKKACAVASLAHLGETKNNDKRGTSIGRSECAFIVDNYKEVRKILYEIDAPVCAPQHKS